MQIRIDAATNTREIWDNSNYPYLVKSAGTAESLSQTADLAKSSKQTL